jgi:uncharacterized protein YcaQ
VFEEKALFYYIAHALSLVLLEDFPLFAHSMRPYTSRTDSWGQRVGAWMKANADLRDRVLDEIRQHGALRSRDFADSSSSGWRSSGWTDGRSVGRMLDFLWVEGRITVVGRKGNERLWDLAERWFPDHTPREPLPQEMRVDRAVEHALRALGLARPRHVRAYFTRNDYPDLAGSLRRLTASGKVREVRVAGADGWFLHVDSLPLVEQAWLPRTVVLSPFDNLVADRARTAELFGFEYTVEIYVPAAKRKRGYYALPILAGDRIIGSADVRFDRARKALFVQQLLFEPGRRLGSRVRRALTELARFVGASSVEYP